MVACAYLFIAGTYLCSRPCDSSPLLGPQLGQRDLSLYGESNPSSLSGVQWGQTGTASASTLILIPYLGVNMGELKGGPEAEF